MACFFPLKGWRSQSADPSTGKRGIVFRRDKGLEDLPIEVACGQCIGCRIDRSKAWAIRCYHEASMYEDNCFVTLTYDDQHCPIDYSCDYRVFQLFMKRLRKKFGKGIRFFHCGEYGEINGRPHYHALLFNHDFQDKVVWKRNENGDNIYMSADLTELWPFGLSTVQDCNYKTAAYCARYVMKKVNGSRSDEHYTWRDPVTGITYKRKPEYCQMSLKPGIGDTWFKQYKSDVFPCDFVIVEGKKLKVPRFYLDKLAAEESGIEEKIISARIRKGKRRAHDNTKERLAVRKEVLESRLKTLKRNV